MVFHLASSVTGNEMPRPAVTSRRALTVNSRNRISAAGTTITGLAFSASRPSTAAQTSTLSAIGSRIAPQTEVAFSFRASQPSKKSVTAATTKAINAQRSSAKITPPEGSSPGMSPAAVARAKNTNNDSARRAPVSRFGKAFIERA